MSFIMNLKSRLNVIAAVLLVISIAITLPAAGQVTNDEQLVLTVEPSVRNVASTGAPQPKSPLKRAKFSMEITSRPNAQSSEVESRYERVGDGLWGVMSTLKRSSGTGAQQLVSVCGMFEALAVTSANATFDRTAAIPIGKLFVPFGMKTSVATDSVARLSKLNIEPNRVCAPAPGAAFSYTTQTETQYKVSPGLGTLALGTLANTVSVTINGRCEVSDKMPATALHRALRGGYLEVMCSGTNDAGKPLSRKYAYLIDSAFYILLETKSEANQFRYTIEDVEYE
jgi:hypothetical protein